MREQTVVQHPVAGEVTLSPSLRARRVSINVRPSGEVRLVYPCRMPARRALAFLDEKSEWVLAARERMARKRAALPPPLPRRPDCRRPRNMRPMLRRTTARPQRMPRTKSLFYRPTAYAYPYPPQKLILTFLTILNCKFFL